MGRRRVAFAFCLATLSCVCARTTPAGASDRACGDDDGVPVTFHKIWAARDADGDGGVSPEKFSKYRKLLEDSARAKKLNLFRFESDPTRRRLPRDEATRLLLPEKYALVITPLRRRGTPHVKLRLEPPAGKGKPREVTVSCAKPSVILTPVSQTKEGRRELLVLLLIYEK